ncbi:4-azaleucine resistance probable transporter AzlC [Dehalogenimonas formicexedens]|uniref:4-azaleucine resistance probable transporter AzlC n=1 Tax=Dehalogenimonas formicexedens TaxID=1839801 RepID=A0A1P8F7Y1_9CHLR|nr:AzlC family ABC transporter permease [Dehalogenimonas formicexedens]APV44577.1 4-azaleucine resistance probable transporter AzlC [Dehalogenimonas formicexedens]
MSKEIRQGVKAALPIVLGYLPVGMAYGVLARAAGLSTLETGAMSLMVFAGASQFIAVGMLSAGIAAVPIIITTLAVNSRHLLMSSAIAPYFKGLSLKRVVVLASQLTDESFAVAMADTSKIAGRPSYQMGLQITAWLAWFTGSLTGAVFGSVIDSASFGIPFAMTALFICLLVIQIKSRTHLLVAMAAGMLALSLKGVLPNNLFIVAAAIIAPICGLLLSQRRTAAVPASLEVEN